MLFVQMGQKQKKKTDLVPNEAVKIKKAFEQIGFPKKSSFNKIGKFNISESTRYLV